MPFCPNCGIERKSLSTPCSVCGAVRQEQTILPKIEQPEATRNTRTAKIKRKRKTSAVGILLELVGLILLFLFPIGTLIGIILLVVGGRQSLQLVCSECGNPVNSKDVKLCPVCKAVLK